MGGGVLLRHIASYMSLGCGVLWDIDYSFSHPDSPRSRSYRRSAMIIYAAYASKGWRFTSYAISGGKDLMNGWEFWTTSAKRLDWTALHYCSLLSLCRLFRGVATLNCIRCLISGGGAVCYNRWNSRWAYLVDHRCQFQAFHYSNLLFRIFRTFFSETFSTTHLEPQHTLQPIL